MADFIWFLHNLRKKFTETAKSRLAGSLEQALFCFCFWVFFLSPGILFLFFLLHPIHYIISFFGTVMHVMSLVTLPVTWPLAWGRLDIAASSEMSKRHKKDATNQLLV